jgi:hypothetical protein
MLSNCLLVVAGYTQPANHTIACGLRDRAGAGVSPIVMHHHDNNNMQEWLVVIVHHTSVVVQTLLIIYSLTIFNKKVGLDVWTTTEVVAGCSVNGPPPSNIISTIA